jgi:hypothetical protein
MSIRHCGCLHRNYSGCQKYVPIELVNLSKVIASEAKQSPRFCKRLLRRKAPRNDSLSEHIFDSYYICSVITIVRNIFR